MFKVEIRLSTADALDEDKIKFAAAKRAKIPVKTISEVVQIRRSIDARKGAPKVVMTVAVYQNGEVPEEIPSVKSLYKKVDENKRVIIVGAGPAGYYAALELLEYGIKPIVLERGKDVQARRRDLRAIQQFGEVNPHSNYCFGEGGAGAYSDGKLYTRSSKRGDIKKALRMLVEHGAQEDILVEAHPHIGSNKLPKVVAAMRETIREFGGEVHFDHWVTDFIIEKDQCKGVIVNGGTKFEADHVILATGHSARDIYTKLAEKGIHIEAKSFALGVRIEHPQPIINDIQYRQGAGDPLLPAASYSLTCQVKGAGVFSFCMCPGGIIVPAATAPGEIVVNGMSLSRRDSPYANSGMVVAVGEDDFKPFAKHGPLAGMEFQKSVEQAVFKEGDGSQNAPAQRMVDFVEGRPSKDLPDTSYIPGIHPGDVSSLLPNTVSSRLKGGFKEFGRKMRGYYTNEAKIVATESRTSSPVKIPRDKESLEHVEIKGLYPCGEGAGYAGGIISAAMDGQRIAHVIGGI